MPLPAGTRFGPYTVVSFIGAGGMGEIYKARDSRLDRTVALKVLPQTNDGERRQRFEREARAISHLQHPHICTLFDVGSQDRVEYLVMEFLEGQTLAERLEKGALSLADLERYAAEIADALDHAHRAGICHRDLKPANIMLTKTGVKLLDFGLARALESETAPVGGETASMALTREGVVLGTLPYMSPEQLEGKPGDARTDIFAFGAVLYEMATGRRAFDGKSGATLITQIMSADPPPMRAVEPVTPMALERIVKRCLVKEPEQRWQSARDITIALEWMTGESSPAVPARRLTSREWIAWALFLTAAIGAAAAYLARTNPEAPAVTFAVLTPAETRVPTVAPDGSRIAYIAGDGGAVRIWVRALDNLQARPLAGTEGARSLFWSPDGHNIAFDAGGTLKRIPAEGGVVQTICDAPNMRGGTWSQDGTIVFAPNVQTTLYRVPASGGDPVPLTTLDASRNENSHRWPQFFPDGKHFLYLGRSVNPGASAMYAASIDPAKRAERKLILKTNSNAFFVAWPQRASAAGYLLYVRDKSLLAQPFDVRRLELLDNPTVLAESIAESTPQAAARFSASSRLLTYGDWGGGSFQLVWFDRTGKRLSNINTGEESYARAQLSPDGKRVAATALLPRSAAPDVFLVDLARNVSTRFSFSGTFDRTAIWSPDEKYIAYTIFENGNPAVVKKLSDGSGPEQVVMRGPISGLCDWSRDGKWILYRKAGETTRGDLWVAQPDGSGARVFVQTAGLDNCGQFSPDGKWVAYSSDVSGQFQIYVQAFPSGGKWQISKDPATQPRWRRDGKELFFFAQDDAMMAADIRASTGIEPGSPRKLFPIAVNPGQGGIDYDVTADGQKFVIPLELGSSVAEPITAVLNWTSLLKK